MREPVSRPQTSRRCVAVLRGLVGGRGETLSGWKGSTPFTTPGAGTSDLFPQLGQGSERASIYPQVSEQVEELKLTPVLCPAASKQDQGKRSQCLVAFPVLGETGHTLGRVRQEAHEASPRAWCRWSQSRRREVSLDHLPGAPFQGQATAH